MSDGTVLSADFTISPSGTTVTIGDNITLTFPANSVCDPSTSSYGDGHWDEACTPISGPLAMHVTYGNLNGSLGFDFSPAIRFVPTGSQSNWVTISTMMFASQILANKDYYAGHKEALYPLSVYYAATLGGAKNKDWKDDKTLVTKVDLNTGRVWRRIKHFSGYLITTGEPCDPSPDNPDCIDDGDGGHG